MSKLARGSKLPLNVAADAAALLLANYSFDLGRYKAAELVGQWLTSYPAEWVLLAAIEALYQGRYKAKSVEQILRIWMRRQEPLYHFNQEFERLICRKLPANLTDAFAQSEADIGPYGQDLSYKSYPKGKIAPDKSQETITDAGNQETQQYVSPFDAMSGTGVAIAANNAEAGEIIIPQPTEASLPSQYGKLTVADSWVNKIGPINQFEPAEVDSYLYTKLKTLAEGVSRGA